MNNANDVILNIMAELGVQVQAMQLVKLVYLVDYVHFQHFGETVTGFEYHWDRFGPNAIKHGIIAAAEPLLSERKSGYGSRYFSLEPDTPIPALPARVQMVLSDVVHRYGKLSVEEITAVSKETAPFEGARPYDRLQMEQSLPAMGATEAESRMYHRDLEEQGTWSLEQIKKEYGLC